MNIYYRKSAELLTKDELSQVVNPELEDILFESEADENANVTGQVLLRNPEFGGLEKELSLFNADESVVDGLDPYLLECMANAEEAMPVTSEAERVRQEAQDKAVAEALAKATQCSFENLKLKFSRASRNYSFAGDAVGAGAHIQGLGNGICQVVGPKSVFAKYEAQCVNGKTHCTSVDVLRRTFLNKEERSSSGQVAIKRLSAPGEVEILSTGEINAAQADWYPQADGILNFIKYGLFPELNDFEVASYRFTNENLSCSTAKKYCPRIEVFPHYEWSGKIGIGMALKLGTESDSSFSWDISSEVKGRFGATNVSFKPKSVGLEEFFPALGKKIAAFKQIMDSFRDTKLDGIKNLQNKMIKHSDQAPMECEIKVAHLTLEGGYKLKEDDNKPIVVFARERKISFDPLVSAEVKMDLIPAIVQRYAGKDMASFIKMVLEKASKQGVGTKDVRVYAGVSIELKMKGAISGSLNWGKEEGTTKQNAKKVRTSGTTSEAKKEIKVDLTFECEAKVFTKAKIWRVVVEAGMLVKATGAKEDSSGVGFVGTISSSRKDNGDPEIEKAVTFTGLAIVYTVYGSIGTEKEESEEEKLKKKGNTANDDDLDGPPSVGDTENELKEEESKKLVLLNWWKWTKDGIITPTDNGEEDIEVPNESSGMYA